MFNKLSISDVELKNKRVFTRLDLNVPLKDGKITDDTRIRESLPTIKYSIEHGAISVLASHLGRPKGERKAEFSLKPVAEKLGELLGRPVIFLPDCIGEIVNAAARMAKPGAVLLLENLRFYKGEEKNEQTFARQLSEAGDLYVNDAFGASHRAHASVVGITQFLSIRAAGFLMQKEIQNLGQILMHPEKPFTAIIGGAKISDKIEVISNLLNLVDNMLIGGAMAYTFLKSRGQQIGDSLCEQGKLDLAKGLMEEAAKKKVRFLLPTDHLISKSPKAAVDVNVVKEDIPAGWIGVDIGGQTITLYQEVINGSRTILWNGPLGIFEVEEFAQGTLQIARAVANSRAVSVVGGGDSIAALKKGSVINKITHVSTGGGASLEFLAGKRLPGIEVLSDKP